MPLAPAARERPTTVDRETLSTVYERELTFVWRALQRLGIPQRDLADVTHDVFLVVFRRLHTYDATRPFRPWLFGVTFRVSSEYFNRASHRREVFDDVTEHVDVRQRPDLACEARERWRIVDRALGKLSLGHRAVVVMHDFLGHRGHEVAAALEIPLGTVYSRLYAARSVILEVAGSRDVDAVEAFGSLGSNTRSRLSAR